MKLLCFSILGLFSFKSLVCAEDGEFVLRSAMGSGLYVVENEALCGVSEIGEPINFTLKEGLADAAGVSLESVEFPGFFLRHQSWQAKLHPFPENDQLYALDATFEIIENPDGTVSFRSKNYPNCYLAVTGSMKLFIVRDPFIEARSFYLEDTI